jgi:hypothetical protein
VFTRLPPGRARDLAARANEAVGRRDGSLHAPDEVDALFDRFADGTATLPDGPAALQTYRDVLRDKAAFFAEAMYVVEVRGWPEDAPTLDAAGLFGHWRARTNALRQNFLLATIAANHVLATEALTVTAPTSRSTAEA